LYAAADAERISEYILCIDEKQKPETLQAQEARQVKREIALGGFRTPLDTSDINKKRDEILGKVQAAATRFVVHEVEAKCFIYAKKSNIDFPAGMLQMGSPEISLIGLKTKN
jgi:hypothetical protein